MYAKHFTVDDFPSVKNSVCVHSTIDGRIRGINLRQFSLSYMRRYKIDQPNKMTINNEQKFEFRII